MFNESSLGIAESATVAKKKASPKANRAVPQSTLVAYKGSQAFLAWLKRLADFSSLPITNTMDLALKQYAERIGFTEPMPKRQVR